MRKRLPKSVRKFIRRQKARLRREVFEPERREEAIRTLYEKIRIAYTISPGGSDSP